MAADEKEGEKINLKGKRNDGSARTEMEKAGWHMDGWMDENIQGEEKEV